jgi:zona occludens toxin (predicted ATPase)
VALAVNLLLVLVLGVLIVKVATLDREPLTAGPATTSTATPTTAAKSQVLTRTEVPGACLDAAELADEVISRLDRNVRDRRLFAALRDYTIASQACRRAASP